MSLEEQLKQIKQERENHITRIFWAGLEIALLFGVPLGIAILIIINTEINKWILLPITFVISWILMIMRFKKLSQKMKELDKKIKELTEKLSNK